MITVDELLGGEGIGDEEQAEELVAWAHRRAAQLVAKLADDPELGPLLEGASGTELVAAASDRDERPAHESAAMLADAQAEASTEVNADALASEPSADETPDDEPLEPRSTRSGDSIAGPLPPVPESRAAEDQARDEDQDDEEIEELDDIELLEDDDLELVEDEPDETEPAQDVPEWKTALATAQADDSGEIRARSPDET